MTYVQEDVLMSFRLPPVLSSRSRRKLEGRGKLKLISHMEYVAVVCRGSGKKTERR